MAIVEQGMIKDIRFQLYNHLHTLPIEYFNGEKKGNLISRIINDVKIINDSVIAFINSLFRDPPLIITYSIILLIIFILFPLNGLVLSKIGNSLKRKSIKSQEKISDLTILLDETLSNIRIVKAYNMEKYEVGRYAKENKRYFNILVSLARKRAIAGPITEMSGVILAAVILYFVGSEILLGKSDMTPGTFLFYISSVFQIMPSLKLFGQVFNSIQEGIAAGERVFSILDIKPKIFDSPDAVIVDSFNSKIEYKNVSFRYETGNPILKNINCSVQKGEIVAIVGPSGAGKSTMIDLIPRFYDVIEGSILIDGIDIKKINITSLRKLMGIVTQETILFNDTIKNNIAYGLENADNEKIIQAAKSANAHNFISKLPEAYETIIGDRGVKLSGGERQRLAIARALLKNPPILILDEATSSLDTESEILVQQAIERLMHGRTSIVIAHRLSTIQSSTKILVLKNGELVEEGKHQDLLKMEGLYKKLFDLQFRVNNL
jgi:subfamily B ATP-binding cassette protein MsbA